ncbi:MAG: glycoside hydrolase family 2 TIM barrel-domain containing protein [Phycisphaerales bacterium]
MANFFAPFLMGLGLTVSLALADSPVAPRGLVSDGTRAVLDLGGMWEGRPGTLDLSFPPPADGWQAVRIPEVECTRYVTHDDQGPYYPPLQSILTADGKGFKDSDKLAAWFRRSFDLIGGVPAGQRALLRCDGIAFRSKLWLNGRVIGESVLGMVPNTYDVTDIVKAGSNDLVVGLTSRAGLVDMEHKTFIAPVTGVMPGIWGDVRLELVPEIRIDDVWVRTLVAKKRIEVDVTLVNAGKVSHVVEPVVVIRGSLPAQTPQVSFSSDAHALEPGESRVVTLSADWIALHLWTPTTPSLYCAEVTTTEAGRLVDHTFTRFGFREFTAKGRDFLLNGRRQVLLRNSWLAMPSKPQEDVMGNVARELVNYNSIRQHISFINPNVLDEADTVGLMVIPEFWGWYRNDDRSTPKALADLWLPNTAESMAKLVRKYRNHPSIIMWSVTNETFWNDTQPALMAIADKLVAAIRSNDSTRLLQGDAELTWDGRLDAISIHYPEGGGDVPPGPADIVGRRYPNSGWVIPNDLDWLKTDDGVSRSWRAAFTWDRPLMIGEYHCPDDDDPAFYCSYSGDEAYDLFKWTTQNFGGRDSIMPREDNPWVRMVRMSTDSYRAKGVACVNPWTATGIQLMPSIMVRPLDYYPNAFGGEPYSRKLIVINDGSLIWNSYNNMHVEAYLMVNDTIVWQANLPARVELGQKRELTLTLTPPAVSTSTQARLILRLCCMYGSWSRELYRHEEDMWIVPRSSLAQVSAAQVALVDVEKGATTKALNALGLKIAPAIADDAGLAGKRLLIIGEGAIGQADLDAAVRFIERGGRLLVLHQTKMPAFLPVQPELDPRHAASMTWRLASDEPALKGIEDAQLRWWRPDHLVVTESFQRPTTDPILAAAVSGGRSGMDWSPLAEVRCGKGNVTFCQYLLSDRVDVEPVAGMILAQAIQAAVAAEPAAPAPALRLAKGVTSQTRQMLALCNVSVTTDLDTAGPLLVDATVAPDAQTLDQWRSHLLAGGKIWLRGLNEKTLPHIAALLPWTPGFAPLPKGVNYGARRGDDPLMDGLGHSDFYWCRTAKRTPTCPLGGPVIVPPTLQSAEILMEPALLLAVPVGKGTILIDQLSWEQAMTCETQRATRIVSCLARNLGAGFSAAAARRYRWAYLDLTTAVNRSYYDPVAGDGRGGWSDQGDNDMRYFLTNHTGMINGMAVATQAFPTEVSFNGVSFHLIDPKANHDKAVLTLRGGDHDPAAPAEVKAIPAGNVKADRIWFLHTACWSSAPYGTEVARYQVNYADGTHITIPVRQGREIGDWWNSALLAGASVAWNGRNEKTNAVVIFNMPWDNPHPEKPIASIDVIGNLTEAQLILLGVTFGSADESDARTSASWDCGSWSDGSVPSSLPNGKPLVGQGTLAAVGGRSGLRLTGGQCLTAPLNTGPIAEGKPFAIEIQVAPEAQAGGALGGLVQAGDYDSSGVRLLVTHDVKPVVEIFTGPGHDNTKYLSAREPLAFDRFSTVRFEYDGKQARILVNGSLQNAIACPPPKPWKGDVVIGKAGGKDYFINAVVANVRIQELLK